MDGRTERNLQEKERRMEKKELKLRLRGLLALVLAFGMMFGTSMTVLAAEYTSNNYSSGSYLNEGDRVNGGDTFVYCSGDVIYVDGGKVDGSPIDANWKRYTFQGSSGKQYYLKRTPYEESYKIRYDFVSVPPAQPTTTVENTISSNHKHSFQWIETLEPTLQNDGLMQHKCECGAVDDQYIIPGALAYFRMYCAAIQNAPQNGTVEWNPYNFRCYTRRMMEELAKRPDVTLTTTYTEADGTVKSFTIPAGQAPADSEQFYGFTYLGNLYGWN